MKKFRLLAAVMAMVMTIAVSFVLTGCQGKSDAGRYDVYSITANGETMNLDQLKELYAGMGIDFPEMYLQLNEDGTGMLVMGEDDSNKIEWKSGVITADGGEIKYTIDGDKLSMEKDGQKVVFKKA
ncbi:MAG: hypothetical protein ACI4JI_09160 [Ruminiclostridium sp.]